MKFPITSAIEPVTYGKNVAKFLRVDGNAGRIPPEFQFSVFTSPDADTLCAAGLSAMTDQQWDEWKDQENAAYILECVAANEGFTLIAPVAPAVPSGGRKKTGR